MKSRSVSVTILVFLLHCFSVRSEEPLNIEAVYFFGDSGFDCGNNNGLDINPKIAKANYKPYGVDFDGGPTGRFTNGKNVADFIAEKLGLPLAPAYLSVSKEKRQKIATGLNYASASGGILSETGTALGKCVPFDKQIDLFQRTVEEDLPPQFSSKEEVEHHLSRSIIVINIGSSDFLNNWIDQEKPEYKRSKKYPQIPKYVNLLMETLQGQIQRIYDLGGRRFLVFGLGPLGCVAAVTHKGAPCNESWNGLAVEFNNQLAPLIKRLQSKLQRSIIALEHAYNLILDLHRNPSRYGFKSVNQPCCMVSSTEPALCVPGTTPCENRDEHLYYDMFHGTSKTAEIVVDSCFDAGSSTCDPNAIRKMISDKDM
ncbi:hypothetical protein H6P81_008577 [Aristolochia fimbriata]|uniref:Uncharacterized protein n=1 Tax=Aristolochia fimbriata TaxID=158543 RepID=A0AAV7EIF8_ARIFI|nr:hypothetical protein H6P81_008577 [Aristolochia fimbriata]